MAACSMKILYLLTRPECDWQCVACPCAEHQGLRVDNTGKLTARYAAYVCMEVTRKLGND